MLNKAYVAIFIWLIAGLWVPVRAGVPVYSYRIVAAYPHDSSAFTQGLVYHDGYFFESTGLNGRSSLRLVEPTTGKVKRQIQMDARYFGEGITLWRGQVIGLTWEGGTGFVWRQKDFKLTQKFSYKGEGWGLTQDGRHLIMSDGTPNLRFLDPKTYKLVKTLSVTLGGQPVSQLNELEWVNGEILANIWQTQLIIRINPTSGDVIGIIDLTGLVDKTVKFVSQDNVLNGIAYDAKLRRLFVTGKLWPKLYQIEVVDRATGKAVNFGS
jgi:glutaminyl-peptide cyclotransferase